MLLLSRPNVCVKKEITLLSDKRLPEQETYGKNKAIKGLFDYLIFDDDPDYMRLPDFQNERTDYDFIDYEFLDYQIGLAIPENNIELTDKQWESIPKSLPELESDAMTEAMGEDWEAGFGPSLRDIEEYEALVSNSQNKPPHKNTNGDNYSKMMQYYYNTGASKSETRPPTTFNTEKPNQEQVENANSILDIIENPGKWQKADSKYPLRNKNRRPKFYHFEDTPDYSVSKSLYSCHYFVGGLRYECANVTAFLGIVKTQHYIYTCCPGFSRDFQVTRPCQRQPLLTVRHMLQLLDAREIAFILGLHDVRQRLLGSYITLFTVPDPKLYEYYSVRSKHPFEGATGVGKIRTFNVKEIILNHIVRRFIDARTIYDNQIERPFLRDAILRFNIFYPDKDLDKRITTVNCVPITRGNTLVMRGVLHIIDEVIPPVTLTVRNVILRSLRLRFMGHLFMDDRFARTLNRRIPYTIILPSDKAMEDSEPLVRETLQRKGHCSTFIIRNIIVPVIICPSFARSSTIKVTSLDGTTEFVFATDDNSEITINGMRVEEVIMAMNGLIYIVDHMFIPDGGLRLTQVLKKYNLHRYTSFIRLFDDLEEELNNKTNKTFMVPTNQAMETIWQDYLYDDDIGKKAYAMIKYHILEGVIARNDFVNYRFVETESSIQVRLGYTIPSHIEFGEHNNFSSWSVQKGGGSFNCINILKHDIPCCDNIVHVISEFRTPPSMTIGEILLRYDKYRYLRQIINGTSMAKILMDDSLSLTFLATTNDYMDVTSNDFTLLKIDKAKAEEVISYNIIRDVVCCDAVTRFDNPNYNRFIYEGIIQNPEKTKHDGWSEEQPDKDEDIDTKRYYRTWNGHKLEIYRVKNYILVAPDGIIKQCDILATNGVIHEVNRLLVPYKLDTPIDVLSEIINDDPFMSTIE